MNKRKGMPTKAKIKKYWANRHKELGGEFDSREEFEEGDFCFACGFECKTERAHIKALSTEGTNEECNIHLLCWSCHKSSELLDGEKYWLWIKERNILDVAISNAARIGINLSCLLKGK